MAKSIMAHPAQESTTRIARGRNLFEEHGDEIRFDPADSGWLVPSQHDLTSAYEVTLDRCAEYCECKKTSSTARRRAGACTSSPPRSSVPRPSGVRGVGRDSPTASGSRSWTPSTPASSRVTHSAEVVPATTGRSSMNGTEQEVLRLDRYAEE